MSSHKERSEGGRERGVGERDRDRRGERDRDRREERRQREEDRQRQERREETERGSGSTYVSQRSINRQRHASVHMALESHNNILNIANKQPQWPKTHTTHNYYSHPHGHKHTRPFTKPTLLLLLRIWSCGELILSSTQTKKTFIPHLMLCILQQYKVSYLDKRPNVISMLQLL